MLDRRFALGGQDNAGTMGRLRQGRPDPVKGGRHIGGVGTKRFIKALLVAQRQLAHFEETIKEHAQAKLCRDTPGRYMGASHKA